MNHNYIRSFKPFYKSSKKKLDLWKRSQEEKSNKCSKFHPLAVIIMNAY